MPATTSNEINPLVASILRGFREDRKERGDKEKLEPEEERRQAFIFTLSRAAEKHGRKKAQEIKSCFLGPKSVAVKASEEKKGAVSSILTSLRVKMGEAQKVYDEAVKSLKAELESTLSILRRDTDSKIREINEAHTAGLKALQEDMDLQLLELSEGIESFRASIKDLTLEQLEVLAKNGTLKVSKSSEKSENGSEWLTVPGGEISLG
jgi:hypothetical protein